MREFGTPDKRIGHLSERAKTRSKYSLEIESYLQNTPGSFLDFVKITKEQFEEFLVSFFILPKQFMGRLEENYAKNQETFDLSHFSIMPMMERYSERSKESERIYIDAPFSYLIRYRTEANDWEQISIISFSVDFLDKLLYIDQLQGGTTNKKLSSQANRARFKLGNKILNVEEVLYDMVVELAKQSEMNGVAILKKKHSRWENVKNSKDDTIYERIAKNKGHHMTGDEHYYIRDL